MVGIADLMLGGVLPAVVAAVTLVVVRRLTGNAASAWRTALVMGYVVGHWALAQRSTGWEAAIFKSFQPSEAQDWLPLAALLAIVPDAWACVGRIGPVAGWLLRALLCVAVPWRLLAGSAYLPSGDIDIAFADNAWTTTQAIGWIGGTALLLLLLWQWLRSAGPSAPPRTCAALAVVTAVGASATLALSGSLLLGQLMGALAAALAGCAIAMATGTPQRGPEAAAGPLVIGFGGILVVAHFFAELKPGPALLLLVAMGFAAGWIPLGKSLSARAAFTTRVVLCLALLAIPLTLAGIDFAAALQETNDNPYVQYQQ